MVKYLIFLALLGHGAGHALGFLAAWTRLPMGFKDRPWLLGGDVGIQSGVGRAFGLLWLAALAGFIAAAVGLLFHQPWWETLAIASSLISVVAIVPWWKAVTPGPRFWALLVDLVVLIGLLGPWQEKVRLLLD